MRLNEKQLTILHLHMKDLADAADRQSAITASNIKHTNLIIYIVTFIGFILTLLIFYYFIQLNQGVTHSMNSMDTLQNQVSDLSITMNLVSSSIEDIGHNIEYVGFLNNSVTAISKTTGEITNHINTLHLQTKQLSFDTNAIRQSTHYISQGFGDISQSVNHVAHDLHETAKPIRQFIPIP